MREITPLELKCHLETGARPLLLDVRETDEVAICRLGGALHVPMGDVPARFHELDPDRELVVYCHHGQRGETRYDKPGLADRYANDRWRERHD
jgi:rhodanese-related sulfurtransferase